MSEQQDIKQMLAQKVAERVPQRDKFNILFITDRDSRLYPLRGITAMEDFCQFYSAIADISLVTMDSKRVCELRPDLSKFTTVWIDNVANRELVKFIDSERNRITEEVLPNWSDGFAELSAECDKYGAELAELNAKISAEIEKFGEDEAAANKYWDSVKGQVEELEKKAGEADEYLADIAEYRALSSVRFLYALDEFIWEGPGGRQNTVNYVKIAEDLMTACDAIVVPNAQLAKLITEFQFIGKKDIAVAPTFLSDRFYPTYKLFKRSNSGVSSIRNPKVLIKGLVIPKAIQDFIYWNHEKDHDKYDITICTGGVLDDRVYKLLCDGHIKNITHWSDPRLNDPKLARTGALQRQVAIERDIPFDFVILTMTDKPDESIYSVADVDNDALAAIACGAVAIAEINQVGYGPGMHICKETGLTFGPDISVEQFKALLEKWRSCASWDNAHEKQRKLLSTRMVGSNAVMGGFYGAMNGKLVSMQRNDEISKLLAAEAEKK